MESLLPYFIEFNKDGNILSKNYTNYCTIGEPNQQPIIMIIYSKNTFSFNDNYQKI